MASLVGPEDCDIVETQDKGLEIATMNMVVVLKDDMNKFVSENKTNNKTK